MYIFRMKAICATLMITLLIIKYKLLQIKAIATKEENGASDINNADASISQQINIPADNISAAEKIQDDTTVYIILILIGIILISIITILLVLLSPQASVTSVALIMTLPIWPLIFIGYLITIISNLLSSIGKKILRLGATGICICTNGIENVTVSERDTININSGQLIKLLQRNKKKQH